MSDEAEFNVTYDVTEMTREQLEFEVKWHRQRHRKLWRKELRRRRFWGLDEQIVDFLPNEVDTLQPPSYEVLLKHWHQQRAYLIHLLTEQLSELP